MKFENLHNENLTVAYNFLVLQTDFIFKFFFLNQ